MPLCSRDFSGRSACLPEPHDIGSPAQANQEGCWKAEKAYEKTAGACSSTISADVFKSAHLPASRMLLEKVFSGP